MTKIFLPATTQSVASIWLEGKLEQEAYKINRLRIKISTIEGALVFSNELTIPAFLVIGRANPDDSDKRLLPWNEAVIGATRALAATALNKLHDNLRRVAI